MLPPVGEEYAGGLLRGVLARDFRVAKHAAFAFVAGDRRANLFFFSCFFFFSSATHLSLFQTRELSWKRGAFVHKFNP